MKKLLLIFAFFFNIIVLQAQTSPPLNMTLHSQWSSDTLPTAGSREYNDIWGWVDCSGNEYAIMGSAGYIHFFDVTDPDNINQLDLFAGGQVGIWRDIKTYKDRAYAVSENNMEGLMIFDMSNIQDTIIKSYHSSEFFNRAHNIYIDNENGRLYCVGTETQNQGIIILDIETDPDNPILLASVPLPGGGYIHDIYVKDNIGYCSHGWNGFYIWDFTDPTNPVYIIDIPSTGYNHSSWTTSDGNYAIYAEEVPLGQPLGIYDISDVSNGNIEIVSTFKFPLLAPAHENNVAHNPYIRGNYVIVSHYHDGIQIFDISDVENPSQVAYYDSYDNDVYSGYSGCWGVYPFLPSGTIIASDINEGLLVLTADSIDFDVIESTSFPDATFTGNTPPYCTGDSTVLEVPADAENYTWYKDGVALADSQNVLMPLESGTYHVNISNRHCTSYSDTIDIEILESPDLSGFETAPVSFCEATVAVVIAPSGFDNYIWTANGDTIQEGSNILSTAEAGNYILTVESGPCANSSEAIVITQEALPNANIFFSDPGVAVDSVTAVLCEDQSTTLAVVLDDNALYQWFEDGMAIGDSENTLEVSDAGVYSIGIINEAGCTNTSMDITVSISDVNSAIIFEDGLLSEVSTGVSTGDTYQWYFEGMPITGATSMNFEPLDNGDYYCELTDSNGCAAISNTLNVLLDNVHNIESIEQFSISPNPTNQDIVLTLESSTLTYLNIQIVHIDGRILKQYSKSISGFQSIPLDMSDLSAGMYFIKLENGEGQMTRKVIKL